MFMDFHFCTIVTVDQALMLLRVHFFRFRFVLSAREETMMSSKAEVYILNEGGYFASGTKWQPE